MIQPHVPAALRQLVPILWVPLAWLGLGGCAHAPEASARAEAAAPTAAPARQRFVPPFAYEAYIRGELALAAGQPEAAALQFEMATAAPDEDAFLLTRLAQAQAESGDRELAERTLADAARLSPCAESVWLTRGTWAERDGKLGDAERAYRAALSCVPSSAISARALARVLEARGASAESLSLAARSPAFSRPAALRLALSRELAQGDVAAACFALESWLGVGAPDLALLEEAAAQALSRRLPALAERVQELSGARLSPRLRAELAALTGDRETLRALLAQHPESALGGAAQAARFALAAGDLERAELYLHLPRTSAASDSDRALEVEALGRMQQPEAAVERLRAIQHWTTRSQLARDELARLGLGALARELAEKSMAAGGASAAPGAAQ